MSPTTAKADRKKSTIVRSSIHAGLRLFFFLAGRLAPEWTARLAGRLFLTPQRHRPPTRERHWAKEAERLHFQLEECQLAAWSWGAGERTVLLVHGWAGRGLQLAAFARPLVRAGRRVVALDLPAHGETAGRTTNLVEMAAAIAAVARQLGGVEAVIAHSAGAAATTVALSRGAAVERVVFLAPGTDVGAYTHQFARMVGLTEAVRRRAVDRIEERVGVELASLRSIELAPRLTQPLLVIHDHGDDEAPLAAGAELVEAWAGARLLATRGLGHYRILRDPEVVMAGTDFITGSAPLLEKAEATPGEVAVPAPHAVLAAAEPVGSA